jgi:hypothetical protein
MTRPPSEQGAALSNPLVESHRVEGTPVFASDGRRIGSIRHLVIEKVSGRVAYVVITFGGSFRIGSQPYSIPWEKLRYDPALRGYRTGITDAQLKDAPAASEDEKLWCDHRHEKAVREYWDEPPFRGL